MRGLPLCPVRAIREAQTLYRHLSPRAAVNASLAAQESELRQKSRDRQL